MINCVDWFEKLDGLECNCKEWPSTSYIPLFFKKKIMRYLLHYTAALDFSVSFVRCQQHIFDTRRGRSAPRVSSQWTE